MIADTVDISVVQAIAVEIDNRLKEKKHSKHVQSLRSRARRTHRREHYGRRHKR
jgi:hypothetical protein